MAVYLGLRYAFVLLLLLRGQLSYRHLLAQFSANFCG
jgi:hypothetical protein